MHGGSGRQGETRSSHRNRYGPPGSGGRTGGAAGRGRERRAGGGERGPGGSQDRTPQDRAGRTAKPDNRGGQGHDNGAGGSNPGREEKDGQVHVMTRGTAARREADTGGRPGGRGGHRGGNGRCCGQSESRGDRAPTGKAAAGAGRMARAGTPRGTAARRERDSGRPGGRSGQGEAL
ncbi:uncharacterized protein [Osmerus mordax]|uniref:uncharacterized protein n=1 Tax=Osmerus mordax TaxID=8014 RepID=UPI00351058B2